MSYQKQLIYSLLLFIAVCSVACGGVSQAAVVPTSTSVPPTETAPPPTDTPPPATDTPADFRSNVLVQTPAA